VHQVQSRQRQAVNRYNQAVRDYNRKVNNAIDQYNREARAHNARVRADRQRLAQALSRLQSRSTVTRYVYFRASVETLHRSYVTLDRSAEQRETSDFEGSLLDLSERENANSLEVMNALLAEQESRNPREEDLARLRETRLEGELAALSVDLDSRWRGALFALHPENPDASRHFCASAREIFTTILEQRAPDDAVKQALPNCRLHEGRPTRRSRIQFALRQKGLATEPLQQFVDDDVENIVQLFKVFNDGTHGAAGRFQFEQLRAIKRRVEDGIVYLSRIFG
jgi:hypothetical protein